MLSPLIIKKQFANITFLLQYLHFNLTTNSTQTQLFKPPNPSFLDTSKATIPSSKLLLYAKADTSSSSD
jgi:hypothetical protein